MLGDRDRQRWSTKDRVGASPAVPYDSHPHKYKKISNQSKSMSYAKRATEICRTRLCAKNCPHVLNYSCTVLQPHLIQAKTTLVAGTRSLLFLKSLRADLLCAKRPGVDEVFERDRFSGCG